ncbi:MAG TPA: GNAT family N-acetyltransferase [Anaerolineales bacterium]|nr:GNAT family N-acetyltransferase [Anaerolineales bacterium]
MSELSSENCSTQTDKFPPSPYSAEPGYTALSDWANLVKKIYGYQSYPISVENENQITAFAILTHIKHPIFGSYLTSAPYSSYGGVWFKDLQSAKLLSIEIEKLTKTLRANYTMVRFRGDISPVWDGWAASTIYQTYRIELDNHLGLEQYSPNHRNHVRKALKKGFAIQIGGAELIEDAFEGLSRSMHELGSPYHSKSYLAEMCSLMDGKIDLAVVRYGKLVAGAGVFIRHGQEVINLHANILRDFRQLYAGEFFYWSMIENYRRAGLEYFDLGRSLIGSGNEIFKLKWNPQVESLNYWYYLPKGGDIPELNQKSPKFQIAIAVWKRLPQFLVNQIGPHLINGIA